VLELEDLEDGAFDLDVVAVLELIGTYDGGSAFFRAKQPGSRSQTWQSLVTATLAGVNARARNRRAPTPAGRLHSQIEARQPDAELGPLKGRPALKGRPVLVYRRDPLNLTNDVGDLGRRT
jgi:hypothetical protein